MAPIPSLLSKFHPKQFLSLFLQSDECEIGGKKAIDRLVVCDADSRLHETRPCYQKLLIRVIRGATATVTL